MRNVIAAVVASLALSLGGASMAGQFGHVVDTTKKAGEVTKDAAKAAGEATKDAAKATGKATKKGATKAKETVTGEAHATCVDGTRHTAKTAKAAAAACTHRGGVARK